MRRGGNGEEQRAAGTRRRWKKQGRAANALTWVNEGTRPKALTARSISFTTAGISTAASRREDTGYRGASSEDASSWFSCGGRIVEPPGLWLRTSSSSARGVEAILVAGLSDVEAEGREGVVALLL